MCGAVSCGERRAGAVDASAFAFALVGPVRGVLFLLFSFFGFAGLENKQSPVRRLRCLEVSDTNNVRVTILFRIKTRLPGLRPAVRPASHRPGRHMGRHDPSPEPPHELPARSQERCRDLTAGGTSSGYTVMQRATTTIDKEAAAKTASSLVLIALAVAAVKKIRFQMFVRPPHSTRPPTENLLRTFFIGADIAGASRTVHAG